MEVRSRPAAVWLLCLLKVSVVCQDVKKLSFILYHLILLGSLLSFLKLISWVLYCTSHLTAESLQPLETDMSCRSLIWKSRLWIPGKPWKRQFFPFNSIYYCNHSKAQTCDVHLSMFGGRRTNLIISVQLKRRHVLLLRKWISLETKAVGWLENIYPRLFTCFCAPQRSVVLSNFEFLFHSC